MIVLAGCAVLSALLLYLFARYRNQHLRPLEIFAVWCASILIIHNYSAIQTMNLRSSIIPDTLSLETTSLINRTLLYPVVILLFLFWHASAGSIGKKSWMTLTAASALTGLEWLSGQLGVFVHVTWPLWGTAVFWLLLCLVTEAILRLMRRKLIA